jgi:glycosyltransferase involved in cell wall biosynthesis
VPHAYAPALGGTEFFCQKISEVLASWDYTVGLVTSDLTSVEGYYKFGIERVSLHEETMNGVQVYRIPFGGLAYDRGHYLSKLLPWPSMRSRTLGKLMHLIQRRFIAHLQKKIYDFKPDVVMTTPHLVINVLAVLEAHRTKPFPLVVRPCLHEEDPNWCIQTMAEALRQADAVMAMTDYEAERLIGAYGVEAGRLSVGGNGVDLPSRPVADSRAPQILFLGRKTPQKGLPMLLEAMRHVWKILPEVRLVLAGARMQESIEVDKLIAALPLSYRQQVYSVDNISEKEKTHFLATSTCLVLPSRIESFGVVLLEAWANGTPVITLDLPVFQSIVNRDVDGLLVPPDNTEALGKAILQLLQNSEKARQMGRAGRRKVEASFTWEQVAERYLKTYKKVMTQNVLVDQASGLK